MGKGFSVVAGEFRKLADDTNKIAAEIGIIVNELQQELEKLEEKCKEKDNI